MTGTRALVGTSGWSYQHWRERFYPADVPQRRWLEYFVEHFPTVELNASFYRQPKDSTFDGWRERTPEGFVFAVKMNRFITHRKRLADVGGELDRFLSGACRLKEKLGPVLVQLPPSLHRDDSLLGSFLELMRGRDPSRELRFAFEFRHGSWLDDHVYGQLREAGCALVWNDYVGVEVSDVATADFIYVRRHGFGGRYAGCYSHQALARDAELLTKHLDQGRDAFVYFNNDAQAFAIENARTLTELLRKNSQRTG